MKTIIAGSRKIYQGHPPIFYVGEAMTLAKLQGIFPSEIISGGARGVDLAGEMWADEQGIPVKRFVPDWSIGKQAGILRNIEMANHADALVAVWDGSSRGTQHMIDCAKDKGLKTFVMTLSDPTRWKSPFDHSQVYPTLPKIL